MVSHELKDYTVNMATTFHTRFDDREYSCLMHEGMKEMIRHDIQTVFLSDESLKGYTTSGLTLWPLDGYEARVEYKFSCYDKSRQEIERFSNYCVKGAQSRLGELGYRMEGISSKAEEMDMGWLGELESMVFCQREGMGI